MSGPLRILYLNILLFLTKKGGELVNERNQQKKTMWPYALLRMKDYSNLQGVQVAGNTAGFC